tara:strand:+ start:1895 stop:2299 length:405 start_codon:yes stop_codon:yes gene_type:complete
MGSARASLRLVSSDVFTTSVDISTAASIIADGGSIGRAKVLKTSEHANALVVYKANDKLVNANLYVKNLEGEKENYVYLYNDTDSDALVAKIPGGEFAFIPVAVDKTYKVYATRVDSLVEFAVFGLDRSDVTLS